MWISALGVPLVFFVVIAVWVGGDVRELVAGESATVRSVHRCFGGGGPATEPEHCGGTWEFGDGRAGGGAIEGREVTVGDTIFAGDDWAYRSASPLYWKVGAVGAVFVGGPVGVLVAWLVYRRRQRTEGTPPGQGEGAVPG